MKRKSPTSAMPRRFINNFLTKFPVISPCRIGIFFSPLPIKCSRRILVMKSVPIVSKFISIAQHDAGNARSPQLSMMACPIRPKRSSRQKPANSIARLPGQPPFVMAWGKLPRSWKFPPILPRFDNFRIISLSWASCLDPCPMASRGC